MHEAVLEWVSRYATTEPVTVLDIGGRDVNGTSQHLFPNAVFTVLDAIDGPGVDIAADAATWIPDCEYDVVVCTEVFEHTPDWPHICRTACAALKRGGQFITTCAGPGRAAHSAIVEGPLQPGEYYGNLTKEDLRDGLVAAGFGDVTVERLRMDLRAVAIK